jgi:asparagine synthase (glutamine-hydrolysing)
MCGLCGVFTYGRDAGPDPVPGLLRMCDAMRARGPDGNGTWRSPDGRLTLGHLRLAIIDLSQDGAQPFVTEDGRYTIVFNGEIYNHAELRRRLAQAGTRFRSRSDTEVIVELYRRHGPSAFAMLGGMYAVALWDEAEGELVLARDPFGIKPLYLADDGGTLRFASQVKALVASGDVDLAPDPAGQVGFFVWGHVPEPFTLYRAIQAFPPGHHQTFSRAGARPPVCFASVRDTLARAEGRASAALVSARSTVIRRAVGDSIRHHHVSDVPVGIFLSAGIDSTAIAAASCEQVGPGCTTFTLGFEEFRGTARDETVLAEAVAQRLGTAQVTRWVRPEDFGQVYDDLLGAMDQPSIDGVNTYLVSKLAAEAGLKVVLSGLGGDEIFGGYPSFRDVPRLARAASLIPAARRIGPALRAATSEWIGRFTSPKYAGLLEYGPGLFGAYLLRRSLFMPWELPRMLDPDLVEAGLDRLQLVERGEDSIRGIRSPHAAVTALELTHYMRNRLLRDADWASMAHSLELRVPLVDWALFEELAPLIAGPLPPRKADLANVPAESLPRDIAERPKTGFEVPVRDWLQRGARAGLPAARGLRDWSRTIHRSFVPA